jgi:high-affinity nickel-transport protein
MKFAHASDPECPADAFASWSPPGIRRNAALLLCGLVLANLLAWTWAFAAFAGNGVMLGTCALAYGFGLRHAVDADHIAAIDNVTRKLMQQGRRPACAGLFFALGHSTIVVAASAAIAVMANSVQSRLDALHAFGSVVGTAVSALFLLLIAGANFLVFLAVLGQYRQFRRDGIARRVPVDTMGFLSRLLRPAFRLIDESWQMYPLGLLFGLGFDTATEIGLLGIAAVQASHGLHIWSILVFPALFTAGMTLIDTGQGLLMLGAYGWAMRQPARTFAYNLTITLLSVCVAVTVAGIEAIGLLHGNGKYWNLVDRLNSHSGGLGLAIIAAFAGLWLAGMLSTRVSRPAEAAQE